MMDVECRNGEMMNQARRTEYAFSQMIDAIPLPVYCTDMEGHYLDLNIAYEKFFGIKRKDLIGRKAVETVSTKPIETGHSRYSEISRNTKTQSFESWISDARGADHDVILNKTILYGDDEKALGQINTIIDITERKGLENSLDISRSEKRVLFDEITLAVDTVIALGLIVNETAIIEG